MLEYQLSMLVPSSDPDHKFDQSDCDCSSIDTVSSTGEHLTRFSLCERCADDARERHGEDQLDYEDIRAARGEW